jgi:hypothetical protein
MAGCKTAITSTTTTGTNLIFEQVTGFGENVGGPYNGDTQIRVIDSVQTPLQEVFSWVSPDDQTKMLAVDYSQYFVVAVFNGLRSSIGTNLQILRVWQNENNIYCLAHFDDGAATVMPLSSSQYQIIKIKRTQVQSGEYVFSLLGESGTERATSTITIVNK